MNYAIIVGGGMGTRMGTDIPKQFLVLKGLPVIMHAIQAFYRCQHAPEIIVVIPSAQHQQWRELCEKYNFQVPCRLVNGGNSRFESVRNGLTAIKAIRPNLAQSLIAVHDAVRPLIRPDLIDATFHEANHTGAAALALQSTNSVRLKSANGLKNNAFPRQQVYLMQTPQIFRGDILAASYEQASGDLFTDDASVVEKNGHPITLVNGDTRNLKITFPEDLLIAALLSEVNSGGASDNTQ